MKTKDAIVIAILLYLLWPRKTPETSVNFPNEDVLKACPGGWTVPYNTPCPPTTLPNPYIFY